MDHRRLGTTDLLITPIGFGAFKIGRNVGIKYDRAYDLPPEEDAVGIVHAMLDLGINYIDTAPAYGLSERRVGKAIAGLSDVVVSTKVGETFIDGKSRYDFSPRAVRASVDNSRRLLGRETLDLVFIHSDGNDDAILSETGSVETLLDLKQQGTIRFVGFSGKTPGGAIRALAWADAIMAEYHLDDDSHSDVIEEAHSAGVGVVVKKGLASGRLAPGKAIAHVLSNPGVSSLVIGGLNPRNMQANIEAAQAALAG